MNLAVFRLIYSILMLIYTYCDDYISDLCRLVLKL